MALDEDETGIDIRDLMRKGGGKTVLPPKPTQTAVPPKAPFEATNPTTGAGNTKAKDAAASAATAAGTSKSTASAYDKYLAQQKADAKKAARKAGNRYIEQAETLGLQAAALRRLLGLGPDGLGLGGKMKDIKGRGGKTETTVKEEKGKDAWHTMTSTPDDPRNQLLHPWQQDDGRGASGNRNKPKKGGLDGVNLPREKRGL